MDDLVETRESKSSPGGVWNSFIVLLKSGGGQGRSPAMSIPEFIITSLKTIYLFCFDSHGWPCGDAWIQIISWRGLKFFYCTFKKRRGAGAEPRYVYTWVHHYFPENNLFILFLVLMDDLVETPWRVLKFLKWGTEVSHESLKILFNNCFVFLKTRRVNPNHLLGVFTSLRRGTVSESPVFYGYFWSGGGEFMLTPEFNENYLFILFLFLMDDLAETRESPWGL